MKNRAIKLLCAVAIVAICTVVVVLALKWKAHRHIYMARKHWKEQAIPEIAKFADDPAWVSREIALLGADYGHILHWSAIGQNAMLIGLTDRECH